MRRNYENLVWNVWWNYNGRIELYNVLTEYSPTIEHVQKCLKKKLPILASEIQGILQWKYWARTECEIMITDILGGNPKLKLDWFMQIMINFEPFLEYLEKQLNIEIVRDEIEDKSWMWD